MSTPDKRLAAIVLSVVTPVLLSARQAPQPVASGDMIDRIFQAREFSAAPPAPVQWLDGGASYAVVERAWSGTTARPARDGT
jgi:hypothetical protein